jgi:hypothetical protein
MKKVGMILGNGLTIDLMNCINRDLDIDPTDLFKYGDRVKWPANGQPGFLSPRHCPNLWSLGARPGSNRNDSYKVIEDLITVMNLYATLPSETVKKKSQQTDSAVSRLYIYAYQELVSYLRELFIYYDSKISTEDISSADWGWKNYLTKLDKDESIESVEIITYNYDLFLERVLDHLNIKFSIPGIKENTGKFRIYKPHGSIGFLYKGFLDKDNYNIQSSFSLQNGEISNIENRYHDLSVFMPVIPLIPPSGEAHRFSQNWAQSIREHANKRFKEFQAGDEVVICGLSYWHVDRAELDEIIRNLNCEILVRMINPGNVDGFSSVLSMVFDNYIHHSSSEILKEIK